MGFSLEKNDRMKLFVAMASLVIILAGIKAASTIVVPFLLSIFIAMMLYHNNILIISLLCVTL